MESAPLLNLGHNLIHRIHIFMPDLGRRDYDPKLFLNVHKQFCKGKGIQKPLIDQIQIVFLTHNIILADSFQHI